MPELYAIEGLNRNDFYDSYIKTYIERDVANIKDIGSTRDFKRFMRELQLSDASGHYLESYIISEIIKNNQNLGANIHLYHIRNKETDEIDLILEKNNTLYPIEIKKTSTPRREMLKNFRMLDGLGSKVGKGGIVCTYDKLIPIDDNNHIIPISSVIDTRL